MKVKVELYRIPFNTAKKWMSANIFLVSSVIQNGITDEIVICRNKGPISHMMFKTRTAEQECFIFECLISGKARIVSILNHF